MVNLSQLAFWTSENDNADTGWCAKGVGNILEQMGLEDGVHFQRNNAHHWDDHLRARPDEWQEIDVSRDDFASLPPGAIIVFENDSNFTQGQGGGAEFGHVEMVARDDNGDVRFISDRARENWGGSVPDNEYSVFLPTEELQAHISQSADLDLGENFDFNRWQHRAIDRHIAGQVISSEDWDYAQDWQLPPEMVAEIESFFLSLTSTFLSAVTGRSITPAAPQPSQSQDQTRDAGYDAEQASGQTQGQDPSLGGPRALA